MRKLKLDIHDLDVESFTVPSPSAGGLGTVRGRLMNEPTNLTCYACAAGTWTCVGPTLCCPATWQQTCGGTCYFTECGWYCHTQMANTCQTCESCPQMGTCGENVTCLRGDLCGQP